MYKACLKCAENLMGRSDKKFCCDSCRNTFRNRRNREKNRVLLKTNNRLRRKYHLLKKLLKHQEDGLIAREALLDIGFEYGSVTRLYTSVKGIKTYFLYDIGYHAVGECHIRLIPPVKNPEKETVITSSYGN
jgi:predicted nucleic acid-binding Zn ribbon protein